MTKTLAIGLENICVAETEMSHVDGGRGNLIIRGHRIEDLVQSAHFEEVCALLWKGQIADDFRAPLGAARCRTFPQLSANSNALLAASAMEAVRAFIAGLSSTDDSVSDAVQVTAAIPVVVAAWYRRQKHQDPIAPDGSSSHAADFLRMLSGHSPPSQLVSALDAYLVTVVDHGLNASTFASRVVASTGSDLISAIAAAIGALKGPLHGGAPGPVLDMLDAIGSADCALGWIRKQLAAGNRIMGMGHRVYRVRDPRAAVLESVLAGLPISNETHRRRQLAQVVERVAEEELRARKPARPICANVEFYTAVLLEAIGVPRHLFSATFAVSRVAGWCAHVMEEQARGRIIRPSCRYIGPTPAVRP